MIIILSAKYVEQDLAVEFGEVPPVFLPVGNKPLYTYQIESIRKNNPNEEICITLPHDYQLKDWDKNQFEKMSVSVLRVERDFSLGQSIAYCLSAFDKCEEDGVVIYYGDTLLRNGLNECFIKKDIVYTSETEYNYSWLRVENGYDGQNESIFCGVLSISKPSFLIRSLISNNFDFEKSLKNYNSIYSMCHSTRDDWLDFGHLNTFYDSKTIVTTERAFNSLSINKNYVQKTSFKKNKLIAEANWFLNTPEPMVHYTPRIISYGESEQSYTYKLDYLYNPTLTEIFVFGNHSKMVWGTILNSCFSFIQECQKIVSSQKIDFYDALIKKNCQRLENFVKDNPRFGGKIYDEKGNSFELNHILDKCHNLISKKSITSFVHGDFCFSNILYDFKKNDIKVIDPRGIDFNDNISIYGDIRYDLAKILHSAIGKYDLIVSDRFEIIDNGVYIELILADNIIDLREIIKYHFKKTDFEFDYDEILAITVTLFISMLPLHYDKPKRQIAFIATAIKLFKEI